MDVASRIASSATMTTIVVTDRMRRTVGKRRSADPISSLAKVDRAFPINGFAMEIQTAEMAKMKW